MSFSQKADLIRHNKTVHEGNKPFTCDFCHAKFAEKQNLTRHMASVHEEKNNAHKCPICNVCFSYMAHLTKHIATTHEEQVQKEKPSEKDPLNNPSAKKDEIHLCSICNSSFNRKKYLNKHIKYVHEKVRPFQCEFCDYKAAQKSSLKIHVEAMHKKSELFICQCGFSTPYPSNFSRHMSTVHTSEKLEKSKKSNSEGIREEQYIKQELNVTETSFETEQNIDFHAENQLDMPLDVVINENIKQELYETETNFEITNPKL